MPRRAPRIVKPQGSTAGTAISDFIARFVKESGGNAKRRAALLDVMGIFNGFLANYGEIASNVERDPVIVTAPISELGAAHFRQFLSWFVIRKVMDEDKRPYAPILRDFAKWLVEAKVLSKAVSKEILETLDELQREPERCEKLAKLLYDFVNRDMPTYADWRQDPKSYAKKAAVLKAIHHEKPQEILDGHFTVARVGPTALWLKAENPEDGNLSKAQIGPVQVPAGAAKLARVGDGFNAAVGKMRGFWKLLETGGVYPG